MDLIKSLILQEKSSEAYYDITLDIRQLFLILAKAFTYLLMSFQVLIYSSQSFQEYYLSYIITKNNILRRICLMNVFKFNNNRIGAMNNSLNLRIDTAESMQSLEKILDQWNKDLKKTKTLPKHKKPKQEKEKERKVTIIDESKELKEIEEEKKDEKDDNIYNEEKQGIKLKKDTKVKLRGKRKKTGEKEEDQKDEITEDRKDEEQNEKIKTGEGKEEDLLKEPQTEEIIEQRPRKKTLLGVSFDIKEEEDKDEEVEQDKILPKEQVFQKIKDILLGGFFTKLYLKINKYASNYMTIKKLKIIVLN